MSELKAILENVPPPSPSPKMGEGRVGVRIGKIAYTNTLPFYHGLVTESEIVKEGYPAQINEWIGSGEIDLAPISSLEYAANPEKYYLLPGLCIASSQYSGSVLLLSKFKITELGGRKIALSQESLSSQALLKILLSKHFQFQNSFIATESNPKTMLQQADACLVIGDSALFHAPNEFVFKYDLGNVWYEWTKKPFCFSVWAVRKPYFNENKEEVYAFHEKLKQTTAANLQDVRMLTLAATNLSPYDQKSALIFSYLSQLVFELNDEVEKGLIEFYRYSAEMKLISQVPKLEWIPEKS